ncbi:hypothetical protein C0995_004266 [Termitomyces sp. Mi166|nr:hypothetical protein C0995_004266 [Termitomyces sp. Mi166\
MPPAHFGPPPQHPVSSDSPSAKIWSVYVAEADRQDRALANSWKGDMDALLIFAGLFSASITAFLIESYKSLTPDPGLLLLSQISVHLATIANGTQPSVVPPDPVPFQPSTASLLCNIFWFLSLAFSLASALAATLVEQWTRNYLTETQNHPAPQIRARVRAYLHGGLQQFGMSTVVETIPTLLHISLFLFLAGLVEFLYPISSAICNLCVIILVICTVLYATVTLLPIFFHHCPYRTPFTSLCWRAWQAVRHYTCHCLETPPPLTMSAARESSAVVRRPARDLRDKEALCRTVESLSDGGELAAFIEGIPGFLIDDSSSADIMKYLLCDKNLNLGPRIVERLHLSVYRDPSEAITGAISCFAAIWYILAYCWHTESPVNDVEEWFNEETLPVLETFAYEGPIIGHYLLSTTALYSSSLLDSYLSSAKSMEKELRRIGVELPWTIPEPRLEQLRVQNYLLTDSPDVSSGCIMALKKWLSLLHRDFTSINTDMSDQPLHPPPTDELVQSVWAFQTLVNEAQITIYNDYLAMLLSDFPPYEALATFYRLVSDYDPSLPVSLYNQNRLVDYLKEYEDIPRLAFDQLLNTVAILDDEELIIETSDIVADYLKFNPDSSSALRASTLLAGMKPQQRPALNP